MLNPFLPFFANGRQHLSIFFAHFSDIRRTWISKKAYSYAASPLSLFRCRARQCGIKSSPLNRFHNRRRYSFFIIVLSFSLALGIFFFNLLKLEDYDQQQKKTQQRPEAAKQCDCSAHSLNISLFHHFSSFRLLHCSVFFGFISDSIFIPKLLLFMHRQMEKVSIVIFHLLFYLISFFFAWPSDENRRNA